MIVNLSKNIDSGITEDSGLSKGICSSTLFSNKPEIAVWEVLCC